MPRIHIQSGANETAPREFSIYTQLKADANGNVSDETLKSFQQLYGNEKALIKGDLSFAEFTALFQRPQTVAASGEGNALGMAAHDASGHVTPWKFNRRDVGELDVQIQIAHTSICHSDIHQARDEWKSALYPMVPGHEVVGIVTKVGTKVTKFKIGDRAGVGCMSNSCKSCARCSEGDEQYCRGCIMTYNAKDTDGTTTYGGYSTSMVVVEDFVLKIPDNLPLEAVAPLLCAGVTVYSPLRYYGLDKPGMSIGVVGLGGLGAHAVKFAKAFGCKVTVISTSPSKEAEAKKLLGADDFVISKDEKSMAAAAETLDGIIDTVSAKHDLAPLLSLIKTNGKLVCIGAPADPPAMPTMAMLMRRLTVGGSLIGGIKQTQDMLDFCGVHNLVLPYEAISADYIDIAFERILKSDVRYRFVINIQGTLIK